MRSLAGLIAALCFAGPAAAKPIDWLPRFETAAITYWGAPSPCATVAYQWVDTIDADADAGQCLIRFNTYKWNHMPDPGMRCVLVFHEIGHLYGHQHYEGGIMDTHPNVAAWHEFAPCRALVDPPKATPRRPVRRTRPVHHRRTAPTKT